MCISCQYESAQRFIVNLKISHRIFKKNIYKNINLQCCHLLQFGRASAESLPTVVPTVTPTVSPPPPTQQKNYDQCRLQVRLTDAPMFFLPTITSAMRDDSVAK